MARCRLDRQGSTGCLSRCRCRASVPARSAFVSAPPQRRTGRGAAPQPARSSKASYEVKEAHAFLGIVRSFASIIL
ncbi:hypothetical protein HMPREF0762_00146 [Slackia exigua ATCC 700122]|uniref:Uncharacterized protein n=1 Tax=Slackia exigua (strain ATCC 700122 / DSM 15923 / CIP 105133 / JCM 11022 / KCTC 5966 / S-7) TaxID=649764 RepID=D0WEC0_SLAES|nr:hypothetical protein HMPREF0762_00146 [Slackia exigua ATCC 700122]